MIRVLPPEAAERIAAGEVVEHPASALKELLENAVDAGARRVEIALEDGGKKLLRVEDDGAGIRPDDFSLLFRRHATSKIRSAEDLARIRTHGFRGEALASLGAVARVRVVSSAEGAREGMEVTCSGGAIENLRPAGTGRGTVVEVRDLFAYVPARLAFLKRASTELSRALAAAARVAVPVPGLEVVVRHGGAVALHVPPSHDLRERIAAAFGADLAPSLLEVRRGGVDASVVGLVSGIDRAHPDSRRIQFWVNRRAIQDRGLVAEVRRAYRGRLVGGAYPAAFLLLEVAPDAVDVNVHPAKAEVRFRRASSVRSTVHASIAAALERSDLAPRPRLAPLSPRGGRSEGSFERSAVVREGSLDGALEVELESALESNAARSAAGEGRAGAERADSPLPVLRVGARFLQVARSFVALEDQEGLWVLDPHAIHERVLLEELRAEARVGRPRVQRLLVPEAIDVAPDDLVRARDAAEVFRRVGLDVAEFGARSLVVRGVPAALSDAPPRELVGAVLAALHEESEPDPETLLEAVLARIACAGAVKLGTALREDELRTLLDRARRTRSGHTCAHGRPAFLRWTLDDLARRFHRHGAFAKGATLE